MDERRGYGPLRLPGGGKWIRTVGPPPEIVVDPSGSRREHRAKYGCLSARPRVGCLCPPGKTQHLLPKSVFDRPGSGRWNLASTTFPTRDRWFESGSLQRRVVPQQCWGLYLETEYHQGHRANFASADLSGQDFSGLNLRGIKMDRAVLRGADFTGTQLQRANLIGVISQEARFDSADLSGARLSGANIVSASFENARLAKADMEFALCRRI